MTPTVTVHQIVVRVDVNEDQAQGDELELVTTHIHDAFEGQNFNLDGVSVTVGARSVLSTAEVIYWAAQIDVKAAARLIYFKSANHELSNLYKCERFIEDYVRHQEFTTNKIFEIQAALGRPAQEAQS